MHSRRHMLLQRLGYKPVVERAFGVVTVDVAVYGLDIDIDSDIGNGSMCSNKKGSFVAISWMINFSRQSLL